MTEQFTNLMDTLVKQVNEKLSEQRETQIIEVLKKHGHTFNTKDELIQFAQERCELCYLPNQKVIMKLDGVVICEWNDKITIESESKAYYEIEFKIIAGR